MKTPKEETEIYDSFAQDLARGVDVVDRKSYEVIIDSRRKDLLKAWLMGKNGIVLDYGCGDGSFSRFIKNELNADVVGVDVSKGMVKYASAMKSENNISYLIADCHFLPFKDGTFSTVIGMGIFHHLNLRVAISECVIVLQKSGFLVAFEPNSLCPLSFIGRRLFKTKIHTPHERTHTHWSFIHEIRRNGFVIVDLRFLSFLGFVFPFIWASKFAHLFAFLEDYAVHLKRVDRLLEKIPITKHLCWQFIVAGVKEKLLT